MLLLQMLHSVGYVRPSLPIPKPLEQTKSSPNSTSSSFIARCLSTGPLASMKQPQSYKDAPSGKILEILRVRNRFAMKEGDQHWSGGFRDLAFKVKVGFQVPTDDAVMMSAR